MKRLDIVLHIFLMKQEGKGSPTGIKEGTRYTKNKKREQQRETRKL